MKQSEIRMGYLPALLALDPEPRVSRETPPRAVVSRGWIAGFRLDLTPADTRGHFGADRLAEVQRAMTAPEAAPPSAPKFKAGDRVRYTAEALGRFPEDADLRCTVVRSDDEQTWFVGGTWQFTRLLELAQDEAPAQPAGVWVKTSERNPPKVGVYAVRSAAGLVFDGKHGSYWDGEGWRFNPDPTSCVINIYGWQWLDTSPQPDAEGWIAHTPGPCPVAGGVLLEYKFSRGGRWREVCDPEAHGWEIGHVTHYRVVK